MRTRPVGAHRVSGVDLAGSPARRTGYCLLTRGLRTTVAVLGDDAEVLERIAADTPDLVVIDAPLSLPAGRVSLDTAGLPHLRACDRELLRRRIRFFPLTLGPMRGLTARGIRLRERLEASGVPVLEGYPGATQDVMGWPRKGVGVPQLHAALRRFGFRGDVADRRHLTHDELDAVGCAWAGWAFLHARGELIGDPGEGQMLLPLAAAVRLRPRAPRRDASARAVRADGAREPGAG